MRPSSVCNLSAALKRTREAAAVFFSCVSVTPLLSSFSLFVIMAAAIIEDHYIKSEQRKDERTDESQMRRRVGRAWNEEGERR